MKIGACPQTSFFQDWSHEFSSSARVRSGLQNHEHASTQHFGNYTGSRFDIRQIRALGFVKGCRNTNEHCIAVADVAHCISCTKCLLLHECLHPGWYHIIDVAGTGVQTRHNSRRHIKPHHPIANFGK